VKHSILIIMATAIIVIASIKPSINPLILDLE